MDNLGERIYHYRERCGLSQLKLAELLDVSRQAVSKWETGSAIPELSKLVRMAEIFGVSLGALIVGRNDECAKATGGDVSPEIGNVASAAPARAEGASQAKTVVGACFIIIGAIAALLLISASPIVGLVALLLCGICSFFLLKGFKHASLWCTYVWFVAISMWLSYGTGTSWRRVFSRTLYLPTTNEWVLICSFAELLVLAVLIVMTIRAFRHQKYEYSRTKHIILACGSAVFSVLLLFFGRLFHHIAFYAFCNGDRNIYTRWLGQMDNFILVIQFILDLVFLAAFLICLVPTVLWIKRLINARR